MSEMTGKKLERMRVFPVDAYKVTQPDKPGYIEPPDDEWGVAYWFWCPGCDFSTGGHGYHSYTTKLAKGEHTGRPVWTFNGNMDKPSFQASLLVRSTYPPEGNPYRPKGLPIGVTEYRCHLYVTDGKIKYLDDCTHELKGKTVDMVPMP